MVSQHVWEEQTDMMVRTEKMEPMVNKDQEDQLDMMELMANQDQMVNKDQEELTVKMVKTER